MSTVERGDRVKDKVTGAAGIVIARSEWLNGCVQFAVKPPADKNGKMEDSFWVDADQLRVMKKAAVQAMPIISTPAPKAKPTRTGGPMDTPAQHLPKRCR